MQNLILDFGNTFFKGAVFEQDNLVYKFSGKKLILQDLIILKSNYPNLRKALFSKVVELDKELEDYLCSEFETTELNEHTSIPIKNQYQTPDTLGKDRLAAAVGAFMLFPKKNLLVIDAGSSITYERVTKNGYLGGGISPGIAMRFNALHHFTGKLPLISAEQRDYKLLGQNTKEAILSGVMNGVFAEVDGIIDQYKKSDPDIFVIITGGDLKHFDKNLKNNIFAAENLVLQGLNFILKYNDNISI